MFLAFRKADGEMRFVGTAFLLATRVDDKTGSVVPAFNLRLVTAKHVIDKVRNQTALQHIFVRVNTKDAGAQWVGTKICDWKFHPTDVSVDVAVLPFGTFDHWDHVAIPVDARFSSTVASLHEVGLGEEIAITGLFTQHHGLKRNIPIIRVGNLAALDEEKVQTEDGLIDAYLVEARSIGGLSGSPVFLNLGSTRQVKHQLYSSVRGEPMLFLLGLVRGHYTAEQARIDSVSEDGRLTQDRINSGIAIVVPVDKVIETYQAHRGPPVQPIPMWLLSDEQIRNPALQPEIHCPI